MNSRMKRAFQGLALATASLGASGLATVAQAQPYGDRYEYRDHREWRGDRHHRGDYRWRHYGGRYGYDGYRGRWRTGQRFHHYRDNRYWIRDYRAYNLPPPRRGYRYYRDDNGDVVMAAVTSGIIGLILGSAISSDRRYRRY